MKYFSDNKRVLFLVHEASKTGASLVLRDIMEYFFDNGCSLYIGVVFPYQAELLEDFNRLGKVYCLWKEEENLLPNDYELVYSNTFCNGSALENLCHDVPVITHVHELSETIRLIGRENFRLVDKNTNLYIACSKTVKNHLVHNFGIQKDRVKVVESFVDLDLVEDKANESTAEELLCELEDKYIVMGSGWSSYRKGTDLFFELDSFLPKKIAGKEVALVWVGGNAGRIELALGQSLSERVLLAGFKENPYPLIKRADVFTLMSREDPFPLVLLESLGLETPAVCFSGSGGADELYAEGLVDMVPLYDLERMAGQILLIANSSNFAAKYAKAFIRKTCSKSRNLEKLEEILSDVHEVCAPRVGCECKLDVLDGPGTWSNFNEK